METGHCKHGEFILEEGCPECTKEARAERELGDRNIVKVKFYSETTGEYSGREYTYYSVDKLKVGDIVTVPVRDTTGKAKVSSVDVPEAEIANFKDKVKTIPAGSIIKVQPDPDYDIEKTANEMEAGLNSEGFTLGRDVGDPVIVTESLLEETRVETAIALRPGEDVEVRNYFEEAMKLLEYARKRVITTIEAAKLATDDLSIIARLKKAMEAKRKEKLAPHEAQVKAIRNTYNFLMTPVLEAERITKEKQLVFIHEQENRQREQEEINRKRMEAAQAEMKLKGELSESVNLVEVSEAPTRIMADYGTSGLVDHWTFEVVDFAQVPDEYKVIDSAMLNAIARKHHDQKPVKGIHFKNEPYLATRAK